VKPEKLHLRACCIGLLFLTALSTPAYSQGKFNVLYAYVVLAAPVIRANYTEIVQGSLKFTVDVG